MTISGVTIGTRRSVSVAPRPRNRTRASPSPSSDPSTVETRTATTATSSVTNSASVSWRFEKSLGYQSVVKPCQTRPRRALLNEKMIRTTIGANRNA